jgi:hypothetical protein
MGSEQTRFHYQVRYAIEAFLIYVFALTKKEDIKKSFAKSLSEKGVNLLENLDKNNVDLEVVSQNFNNLVVTLNKNLPPFPLCAQYPPFLLTNETALVSRQVLAFQNFLSQELRNGSLKWNEEAPIFEAAIDLWKNVATPRYTPKEAMKELGLLIKKGNRFLTQEHQYPVPQFNQYATAIF